MIYAIIGTGLLFVAIGFMVTEKNAKYLLSGYNTMNEEDRKKFDLKSFLPNFRKFHLFLGISLMVIGLIIYYINENIAGIFLGVYPILAYIYFISTNLKYAKGLGSQWNKIGIYILAGTLIFVIGILGFGFRENKIKFNEQNVEFLGSYSETLKESEIESIGLTDDLPKITRRTNGFSLGSIHKGYYKTKDGEKIKLILNSDKKPYILFTKKDGHKIFYSAKEKSNEVLFNEIKSTLRNTTYEQ